MFGGVRVRVNPRDAHLMMNRVGNIARMEVIDPNPNPDPITDGGRMDGK